MCFLAVGKLLEAAEEAAEKLAVEGIEATVWDVRLVRPLDREMLEDAVRHRLVITCEDGIAIGGAGSHIDAALTAHVGPGAPRPPALVLGTPTQFIPHGTQASIHTRFKLDAPGLAEQILAARRAGG